MDASRGMAAAGLYDVERAGEILSSGIAAVVAGPEEVLRRLPPGNWIGGTMRYFMTSEGACESTSEAVVVPMPVAPEETWIGVYGAADLYRIVADAPSNGFSIVIIPSGSAAHLEYAQRAPYLPEIFMTPIVGWISGVSLEELGSVAPLVFDGRTGQSDPSRAIVLHVRLPAGQTARVDAVNIFRASEGGDVITFPADGLRVKDCLVNGERCNFARYLLDREVDTRLPLVADYAGAAVNTSFQAIDVAGGFVDLYAPVFTGIEYHVAAPVSDYAATVRQAVAGVETAPVFACNCILNYLYGELAGQSTGSVTGPMTFGEIAYQLLNQTLVYVSISASSRGGPVAGDGAADGLALTDDRLPRVAGRRRVVAIRRPAEPGRARPRRT